jgi:hypothetical protein
MEQSNPVKKPTKVTEIIAGINLIECPYEVKVPVFTEVSVEKPVFKDKQIDVPSGFDKVVNLLALDLAEKVVKHVIAKLDERLESAISTRLTSVTYPKMIEELMVTKKDVQVDNLVYKDVVVERPIFVDKEVINPVKKDVEVVNAVIIDKPVINAVIEDVRVTNAIVKDIEVERAVIREKTIDVIHKNCFSADGKPLL